LHQLKLKQGEDEDIQLPWLTAKLRTAPAYPLMPQLPTPQSPRIELVRDPSRSASRKSSTPHEINRTATPPSNPYTTNNNTPTTRSRRGRGSRSRARPTVVLPERSTTPAAPSTAPLPAKRTLNITKKKNPLNAPTTQPEFPSDAEYQRLFGAEAMETD